MFKKESETPAPAAEPTGKVDSLIGRDTEFTGDIRFRGGLHVDGKVKGTLVADDDPAALLTISEQGVVEGEIRVPHVHINGSVTGNIHCDEKLVVLDQARIEGEVHYRLLEISVGAEINGKLVHLGENPADKTRQQGTDPGENDHE